MTRTRVILGAALTIAACGGPADPAPDAAVAPDSPVDASMFDAQAPDAVADAPPLQCNAVDDCPCFTSYECPETTACSSAQGPASCLPGPRGTGVAGAACMGEGDCKSSLCLDGPGDALLCSDVCNAPSDCPASLPRCISIEGTKICVRP